MSCANDFANDFVDTQKLAINVYVDVSVRAGDIYQLICAEIGWSDARSVAIVDNRIDKTPRAAARIARTINNDAGDLFYFRYGTIGASFAAASCDINWS